MLGVEGEAAVQAEFVDYCLYPLAVSGDAHAFVATLRDRIDAFVKDLAKDYFWHRQEPVFTVKDHLANCACPHLIHGRFEVGDCVEDEWMLVDVLLNATAQFEVAASVHDLDGDFLLIEAADELPEWIQPEAVANRVFIYRGSVHIVPKEVPVRSVLDGTRALGEETQASAAIQATIRDRAGQARKQPKHRARVVLPELAFSVLSSAPHLTSRAIDALYYRSVDDDVYRGLARNTFKPTDRMITSTLVFGRTAFAQLACQPFLPPPLSAWSRVAVHGVAEELGMKLSCGLDILNHQHPEMLQPHLSSAVLPEPDYTPEDSLRWMDIDEQTFDADFFVPSGPAEVAARFERFMTQPSSMLDGISDTTSDLDSSHSDTGEGSEDEEDGEGLEEREILEAIKNDPDLLMRLLEKWALPEDSPEYRELFDKLRELDVPAKAEGARQKGLADLSEDAKKEIDEYKDRVREQRLKRTEADTEADEMGRSSSDDETEVYSPSFQSFKARRCSLPGSEACSSEEDTDPVEEYMQQLDAELSEKLQDRCFINDTKLASEMSRDEVAANLAKYIHASSEAGKHDARPGPANSLLSMLRK